jgi:ribonuclease D
MNPAELEPPIWVDTTVALQNMCTALLKEKSVAVDTESNSLHAYQERVCLIQFSLPFADYLLDPLAFKDLSIMAPIFSDPNIVKVFHAAEYDLICLKRDFHFKFVNIFDTMLAARILSYPAFGLGSILEEKFGVVMDKRYQKADWAKRPMPAAMLSYARMDTHFLVELMEIMQKELQAKDLGELADEDFFRISKVNGGTSEPDEDAFWRISGAHYLDPIHAAVLKELAELREKEARRRDQPPFKVFHNKMLLQIAEVCPQSLEELLETGVNVKMIKRYGADLLSAVKTGMQAEPVYPPRAKKYDKELKSRIDAIKAWRKKTAGDFKVESDVILPRELVIIIAEKRPASQYELSKLMQCFPWRLKNFGTDILTVLNN